MNKKMIEFLTTEPQEWKKLVSKVNEEQRHEMERIGTNALLLSTYLFERQEWGEKHVDAAREVKRVHKKIRKALKYVYPSDSLVKL